MKGEMNAFEGSAGEQLSLIGSLGLDDIFIGDQIEVTKYIITLFMVKRFQQIFVFCVRYGKNLTETFSVLVFCA